MPLPNLASPKRRHWLLTGLVALSVSTVLVLIGWQWLRQQAQTTVASTQLSTRAQQFIASESARGSVLWSSLRFERSPDLIPSDQQIETACFRLRLPVPTTQHQLESEAERCVLRARLISPPARLVVTSYRQERPEDDANLQLRRTAPEEYSPLPLQSANFAQLWIFQGSDHLTAFAWQEGWMISWAITGITQPDKVAKTEVLEALITATVLTTETASELPRPATDESLLR